jgi:hypothetical protein
MHNWENNTRTDTFTPLQNELNRSTMKEAAKRLQQ